MIDRQIEGNQDIQHEGYGMNMGRSVLFISFLVTGIIFFILIYPRVINADASGVAAMAREASKAVVLITTYDETGTMVSQGSGFIVSSGGVVATNVHVLERASSVIVKLSTGAYYETAGVLAIDCTADLAVLKLKASQTAFPFLKLLDDAIPEVGKPVYCIGNPLASSVEEVTTEGTVSAGIVSGIRKRGEQIKVIQTTAPISSGSSGGPLLNDKGEVIGIMTFAIAMGQNLNFAVSIDHLNPLLAGNVARPVKEMMKVCAKPEDAAAKPDPSDPVRISGTYSGTWKSDVFNAGGAAIVKVNVEGKKVYARALLTGSPLGFKGDDLSGTVSNFSEGVWTVDLVAGHSPLKVRAIFRDDSFLGDYTFPFDEELLMDDDAFPFNESTDRGQWKLKK